MKKSQWTAPISDCTAIFTWDGKSLILDDVVGDDSNDIPDDEIESLREDMEQVIIEGIEDERTTAMIWTDLEEEFGAGLVKLPS